jgi:hypothetical protein
LYILVSFLEWFSELGLMLQSGWHQVTR